jgi:arginyl-tRNA synthetase
MESTIKELINNALKECLGMEGVAFAVERPKELSHGDYATNVALVIASHREARPHDIAEKIAEFVKENKPAQIADISIAGVGFINFSLSKEFFNKELKTILDQKDQWGKSEQYKGKHILVEHSSPNLLKAFHIGHVMNNAIGESIKRLAKFSDATVTTISYPSDVSLGIAKAVYVLMEEGGIEKMRTFALASQVIAYLGDCYVRGTALYEDDESVQPRIREIADNIYKKKEHTKEYRVYDDAKALNMAYFKAITATLGSSFDGYIYESEAGEVGKNIVLENVGKVFTESDGAVIYDGEKDGLHTRVFINKEGNPTYEAKDIGLMDLKFFRYKPDLSIFMTDHQQTEYFKVVLAAVRRISPEWNDRADKTIHRTHGRMTFKGQKMSSRLGGVPSAQLLIDTITEEIETRSPDISYETRKQIAVASLKFSILRAMAGKDINFDPDTSLSFEGDSGPYLQYSTVRAQSVLNKSDMFSTELPTEWQTTDLEKILIHFPEVVARAIQDWSPHFIVTYLLELSQAFNSWYGNTKIIDETNESGYKLALTKSFAQTMTNGLYLLGISVPEKM